MHSGIFNMVRVQINYNQLDHRVSIHFWRCLRLIDDPIFDSHKVADMLKPRLFNGYPLIVTDIAIENGPL